MSQHLNNPDSFKTEMVHVTPIRLDQTTQEVSIKEKEIDQRNITETRITCQELFARQ